MIYTSSKRKRFNLVILLIVSCFLIFGACSIIDSTIETPNITAKNDVIIDNKEEANTVETETSLLLPKCINGLYGFINTKNEWVIEPKYNKVHEFSEGFAAVGIVSEQYKAEQDAVMKENPEEAEQMQYDVDKWGYINLSGAEVIEPQYSHVRDFKNGLAYVQKKINEDAKSAVENYYINHNGEIVIDLSSIAAAGYDFQSDGTAVVSKVDNNNSSITRSGVINQEGNFTIPYDMNFIFISDAVEGYRVAEPLDKVSGFKDTGIIDDKGDWIIDPLYYNIEMLIGSRAIVNEVRSSGTGTQSKIISLDNKIIADLGYGEAWKCSNNMIIYNHSKVQEAKLVLYDYDGNKLLDGNTYSSLLILHDNAVVADGRLINLNGDSLMEDNTISGAYSLTSNLIYMWVQKENKEYCGLYDANKNYWIAKPTYDQIIAYNGSVGVGIKIIPDKTNDGNIVYILDTFDSQGNVIETSNEEMVLIENYKVQFAIRNWFAKYQ